MMQVKTSNCSDQVTGKREGMKSSKEIHVTVALSYIYDIMESLQINPPRKCKEHSE